jgi:hypothetical protein
MRSTSTDVAMNTTLRVVVNEKKMRTWNGKVIESHTRQARIGSAVLHPPDDNIVNVVLCGCIEIDIEFIVV